MPDVEDERYDEMLPPDNMLGCVSTFDASEEEDWDLQDILTSGEVILLSRITRGLFGFSTNVLFVQLTCFS